MRAEHTLGTWYVNVQNKERPAIYTAHDDYLIADCVSGHRTKQEQLANGHLIAAAPDLLDALQAALTRLSPTIDAEMITQARNAIFKAKGSNP